MFETTFGHRQYHPRARLYFLSRMLKGCSIAEYSASGQAYWDELLGAPRRHVLDAFVSEGLMRRALPVECIDKGLTLADLRAVAVANSIKLPSKKAAAIARLFDAIPAEMQMRAGRIPYLFCSKAGEAAVMTYFHEERDIYQRAAAAIARELKDGNLSDAIAVAGAYWKTQVFRRGSFDPDPAMSRSVLAGILGGAYAKADKIPAALLYLISGDYPGQWAVEKVGK